MESKKAALGLPEGSIRAILAIMVIGGTTLAFLGLIVFSWLNGNAELFKTVMSGSAVWFAIVTMIARDYFGSGQSSDTMKETEKIINGNGHSKK